MAREQKNKAAGDDGDSRSASSRFLENVRALSLAVLAALLIRAFLFETFHIPSGSMIPTLLVGDHLWVTKFSFGVRLPFTGTLIFGGGMPDRGDIIVFRSPDEPEIDMIKRVIGLPGDTIELREEGIAVNGELLERLPRGEFEHSNSGRAARVVAKRFGELSPDGAEYTILQRQTHRVNPRRSSWKVPDGQYFVMGDNRDNSFDSRYWQNSFVPAHYVKGRAQRVYWSWLVESGPQPDRGLVLGLLHTFYRAATFQIEEIRWNRIGRSVNGPAD